MGQFLLHAHLGVAEILLLLGYLLAERHEQTAALVHHLVNLLAILVAGVFGESLLVELDLLAALHHYRSRVQPVDILARIAAELLLNSLVEGRELVGRYILAEVVDERCLHVFVKSCVPFGAVVLEHIGRLALLGRLARLCRHHHSQTDGTCVELGSAAERLAQSCELLGNVKLLGVELCHLVEVELALEVAGPLLELLDAVLEVGLLTNDTYRVDTLVHTQ